MERLMRRFGYERMEQVTPSEHHPLLVNIKKRREKSKSSKRRKSPLNLDWMKVLPQMSQCQRQPCPALPNGLNSSWATMKSGDGRAALTNRARFEQALNDSGSDLDYDNDGKPMSLMKMAQK